MFNTTVHYTTMTLEAHYNKKNSKSGGGATQCLGWSL